MRALPPGVAALLRRWPHLSQLARARITSIAQLCRRHLRHPDDADRRAERIRDTAAGWAAFWRGRLDLDALAWETTERLSDIAAADARIARATSQAQQLWAAAWGRDEVLCSVPGIGPVIAPTVRAWFGDAAGFTTGKQAAAFVGLNPSNWESGLMAAPSRPITKEGPPELRLALYQAANVARRRDPQLAVFYRRLMVEPGHAHIQATCAVARKLATRVWATLTRGTPYEFRDLAGTPITRRHRRRTRRGTHRPSRHPTSYPRTRRRGPPRPPVRLTHPQPAPEPTAGPSGPDPSMPTDRQLPRP